MPLLFSFKLLVIHFSNLDNPCELLSAFVLGNGCPCALLVRGIPCTCPFNPSSIDLPPSVFEIRPVNEYIKFFFQVSFFSVYLVQQLYYVLTPIFILQNTNDISSYLLHFQLCKTEQYLFSSVAIHRVMRRPLTIEHFQLFS